MYAIILKWIVTHNFFAMPEIIFFLNLGGRGATYEIVGNTLWWDLTNISGKT